MTTPSIEVKIWMALKARIQPPLYDNIIPLAWPGDDFTPGNVPFLSVAAPTLPPMRRTIGHNGIHTYSSILPLVLRSPLSGLIYEAQLNTAGQIAARFCEDCPSGFMGVCLRFPNRPSLPGGYRDGGWWHQPINIPFLASTA